MKSNNTVLSLAMFDLLHEWILTLCLVLAIAAVISPLLLLMGLKYGTIATLRDKLVQDPVYREIRPTQTYDYKKDWFTDFSKRNDIDFLIPTTRVSSSIITIKTPNSQKIFDLVPTTSNDPLIKENGGIIPQDNQCVLTKSAAEEIGVSIGDKLTARITRSREGRQEFVQAKLEVVAILKPRAGTMARIYTPLKFVIDVENYKENIAVSTRNWPGGTPRPYLSFDGIMVMLAQKLDPVASSGLIIGTGINGIELLERKSFVETTGFELPANLVAYNLYNSNNFVQTASYRALKRKLRGKRAIVMPYVKLSLNLPTKTQFFGLSISSKEQQRLDIKLPWGKLENDASYQKMQQLLLPNPNIETVKASFIDTKNSINFPMQVIGLSPSKYALAPVELLATLRTGSQREITFNDGKFLLARLNYGGFRLYAKTIDDVQGIYTYLKEQGIEVSAKSDEIERIKILDRGLTRIFWLVAIVGIIGGIAALIASLYAAVERKKRELSIMRLIGLSRYQVFRFPIYQALAMAILSVALAVSAYFGLALIINLVFSSDLDMGQQICHLPIHYLLSATLMTVTVAFLSAILAAWKTTQIEPAEALREE
ncbi:FtsX-like permease family protein [Candidatus Halobeggiatoa sp. HSG11]|nr:FtsX-like permease family protein [Candidatus Halobeggiatoa sp. HSG11]